MKLKAYASILVIIFLMSLMGCGNCSPTNKVGPPASLLTISGSNQTTVFGTLFAQPLVAQVLDSHNNPVPNVSVTFTAPTSGATGTFATTAPTSDTTGKLATVASCGGSTCTVTTDANGDATSSPFTAGLLVGSYTVTATVSGVTTSADFDLTNTAKYYAFYLRGLVNAADSACFYALAGSVALDGAGDVLAGEQDYDVPASQQFCNDVNGITANDTIQPGTTALTVDPTTGQGTLTLTTTDALVGVDGVETLGVQFVNANHALVEQFDGTATSSGSMDLQTLSSTSTNLLNDGGYAFTLSGENSDDGGTVAIGGVFSITGTGTALQGVFDIDDSATPPPAVLDTAFSGTIAAADGFGRGTIAGAALMGSTPTALVYYIVGPEAIRIIDVDTADTAIGSAFGQGTGTFSSTSLPVNSTTVSVFDVESNSWGGNFYAAAGMFTVPESGEISGVGDYNNEYGAVVSGSAILGTYSIASNGYGSLAITSGNLGDVSALGLYMTDPNLNLSDPNNTASGLGGALLADLDVAVVGTGVLISQTDPATASFAGNYAFAAQDYNGMSETGVEFDFVGQASVTSLALNGTGLVSDPFLALDGTSTYSAVPFTGTAVDDTTNPGRYTIPLAIAPTGGSTLDLSVVIYQASGGQLLWLDEDEDSLFLGPLEQQGSLTGMPAAKATQKQKP